MTDDTPPPEVQAAAKVVDKWVRDREQQQAQPQPHERAADRYAKLARRPDTPVAMPAWDANRKD
jgi:hypothetical protein